MSIHHGDPSDAERARLRRIGIQTIVGVVAVLVVITVILVASGGSDSRDSILVTGGTVSNGVNKGDTVRVTGQVRNALDGSRFGDRNDSNTIEADRVVKSAAGDDAPGTTPIKSARDTDSLRGKRVTIVGEVISDGGSQSDIISVATPK